MSGDRVNAGLRFVFLFSNKIIYAILFLTRIRWYGVMV